MNEGGNLMDKMIAYCGLVCTDCDAYIATQANDLVTLAHTTLDSIRAGLVA
jgi:hypothetical protein